MNARLFCIGLLMSGAVCAAPKSAAPDKKQNNGPQAFRRTNAQNYKDMILARCIAAAYEKAPDASKDAANTADVLIEWTYFDLDSSPEQNNRVWQRYLNRDYHYPIPDEYKGVKFDLLKCLDMYHSKELAAQVKRLVSKPNHTFAQDHPWPK
jgi:hypothetical protein